MNELITVYVNGTWDVSFEEREDKSIHIYDTGMYFSIKKELYDSFIDSLEDNGFDCYLCPELFKHPDWNGIIEYKNK